MNRLLCVAGLVTVAACAHVVEPGTSSCSAVDPTSCLVECDEGHLPSCTAVDDKGDTGVRRAALEQACATDAHPNACARVAAHLVEEGDAQRALDLANAHCTIVRWYPCGVAARAMAALPRPPRPATFAPEKVAKISAAAEVERIDVAEPRALSEGHTGAVDLLVMVTRDGTAIDATVSRSSGNRALDEYAVFTVRRARWRPARVGVVAVDSIARHRIRYAG